MLHALIVLAEEGEKQQPGVGGGALGFLPFILILIFHGAWVSLILHLQNWWLHALGV